MYLSFVLHRAELECTDMEEIHEVQWIIDECLNTEHSDCPVDSSSGEWVKETVQEEEILKACMSEPPFTQYVDHVVN